METSKTKLGADHPSTLTSMANLASAYRNQGRWEEAEKLEVQVMETSKTKLRADHPDTLTSKQMVGAEEGLIQSQDGEQRSHGGFQNATQEKGKTAGLTSEPQHHSRKQKRRLFYRVRSFWNSTHRRFGQG
ncbi:hypothetical protein QBC38DRAFT_215256 [Podospora fimiseda]|uniref:Kinesin light chain n=1 Tax=Podospora fimiseda TaxID=252190 RepID=A0AAN6YJG9_9PEZI|nr:hypothetical protein QBC38DRAFT_215256 [Podospora fimiseda]